MRDEETTGAGVASLDLTTPFVWPDVRGRRVLVLGLGGGADIVSAFAVARQLDAGTAGVVVYGNTKTGVEPDVVALSPHLGLLPASPHLGLRPASPAVAPVSSGSEKSWGTTAIDRQIPRGPEGCPLLVSLPRQADPAAVAAELAALRFDVLVGVDTGGDVLAPGRRPGRDERMLAVLRRLGLPVTLLVIGPGADGQIAPHRLRDAVLERTRRGQYRGAFSLAPLLPVFREHGATMGEARTPNVIVRAHDLADDPVVVPRETRPSIPRAWLCVGLAFALEPTG